VTAGSISSYQIVGQELEGEEQQLQRIPKSCSSSGAVTDGTNANTTSSIYENPEYGIQILCPENWVYSEEQNPLTGDFDVTFMSLTEAQEFGRALQSDLTPEEVAPIIGVLITEANVDLQLFTDLNIRNLTSRGYEIISTNLNATLSGRPTFQVVYIDANRTMFLQDWTIQGGRAYALIYVSYESRFNQFLPIAQDMISSFTITNYTSGATGTPMTGTNGSATTGAVQEEQQQQVEWLLYENATFGVRMPYLSNWTQQNGTITEDDRFILVSEFFSPEEAEGYFAYVTIAVDSMPQTTSIQGYRSQSIDIYRQDPNFEEFQLLSSSMGNFTLAGMPAYSFEIAYTDLEFGPQNMLEVGRIFDNGVYYIQYYADTPIYQKYLPIAERMIESFQIMQH
jgi:hypothetical protein